MNWAVTTPEKRRVLAQLMVSDEITESSRQKGHEIMASIARLMDRCRSRGPMKDAPLELVVALMTSAAETTIDYLLKNPDRADEHSRTSFEALWRMLG